MGWPRASPSSKSPDSGVAKAKTAYVCAECGATALQWFGTCPSCSAVGTLNETISERASANRYAGLAAASAPVPLGRVQAREVERMPTGLDELDRALGGGLVAGQVVLIGGDPGIGKSTLLLQALSSLGGEHSTLYVTGEESAEQVALRARRLGLNAAGVELLAEIRLERISAAIEKAAGTRTTIRGLNTVRRLAAKYGRAPG